MRAIRHITQCTQYHTCNDIADILSIEGLRDGTLIRLYLKGECNN